MVDNTKRFGNICRSSRTKWLDTWLRQKTKVKLENRKFLRNALDFYRCKWTFFSWNFLLMPHRDIFTIQFFFWIGKNLLKYQNWCKLYLTFFICLIHRTFHRVPSTFSPSKACQKSARRGVSGAKRTKHKKASLLAAITQTTATNRHHSRLWIWHALHQSFQDITES